MKPKIPLKKDKPAMGLRSGTNFVKANVNTAKQLKTTGPFNPSGQFTKNDFGEVPEYIHKVRNEIECEKNYLSLLSESQQPKDPKCPLDMELRTELLDSLKNKYDEINVEFQVRLIPEYYKFDGHS